MFASDNIQYDFVTFFGWSLFDLDWYLLKIYYGQRDRSLVEVSFCGEVILGHVGKSKQV